tara:strand:- start:2811 stop:3053 length:243 start_codon:yes stop_codon:yes gene_type:complete
MMFWVVMIVWPLSLLFVGLHALKFGVACGVQYMKDDLKDVGIELIKVGGIKLFKPLYGPHWYEHRIEQAQEKAQEPPAVG